MSDRNAGRLDTKRRNRTIAAVAFVADVLLTEM
jgi:hypothetical protein